MAGQRLLTSHLECTTADIPNLPRTHTSPTRAHKHTLTDTHSHTDTPNVGFFPDCHTFTASLFLPRQCIITMIWRRWSILLLYVSIWIYDNIWRLIWWIYDGYMTTYLCSCQSLAFSLFLQLTSLLFIVSIVFFFLPLLMSWWALVN